jgi:hypothetical protein
MLFLEVKTVNENDLTSSVSEYQELLRQATGDTIDVDRVIRHLSAEHEWTESGARAIVSLATDYGVFVLRNALALAIALDIQDGQLGF